MTTKYIDFKIQLETLCPNLISYYGPSNRKWHEISKKYNKRVLTNAEKLKTQSPFTIKSTIYDLVIAVLNGNNAVKYFLSYIDSICLSLYNKIPKHLHSSLKKSILPLFENFGDTQSNYRDKLNEIAILEKILSNSELSLYRIEYPLSNGKSFDFAFSNPNLPGRLILVEIYNIDIDTRKIENSRKFMKFLKERIENKLDDKLKNVVREKNTLYLLVPLVWGNLDVLAKYQKVFWGLKEIKNVFDIMTYLQLTDHKGFYEFRLNSINKILEDFLNLPKSFN